MNWPLIFGGFAAALVSLVVGFVAVDLHNSRDNDPSTPTASALIIAWRGKGWRRYLLGGAIGSLVLIPLYLFLELVLGVI